MSFLTDYMLYSSGNEASPTYHKWCALSTLGSAVSRRVWVSQGQFMLYPNLYIILVGDPASGKTTAMNFAKRMQRDMQAASPTKHPAIAPAAITKEAFTLMMGDDKDNNCQQTYNAGGGELVEFCHVSVFANELITFLGTQPNIMIEFLTDIYDQEAFEVRTKNKGTDLIRGPFINIIGCMTPQMVDSLSKQRLITGGFTRRCNFIYATTRGEPVPRPQFTEAQKSAYARCLLRVKQLTKLNGQFKWTEEAEQFFDAWYHEKDKVMKAQQSIVLQGYYRSLDQMLLRITMLCSLAETDEMMITKKYLEQALGILHGLDVYLDKTFSGSGRNELAGITEGMLQYLANNSPHPVARTKLASLFWSEAKTEEFDACIRHLVNSGKITIVTKTAKNSNLPVEFIKLKVADVPPEQKALDSFLTFDPSQSIDLSSVPLL